MPPLGRDSEDAPGASKHPGPREAVSEKPQTKNRVRSELKRKLTFAHAGAKRARERRITEGNPMRPTDPAALSCARRLRRRRCRKRSSRCRPSPPRPRRLRPPPATRARPGRAAQEESRKEGRAERGMVEGRRRHPREDQRHVLDEIRERPQGYADREARRPGQRLRRQDAEGTPGRRRPAIFRGARPC